MSVKTIIAKRVQDMLLHDLDMLAYTDIEDAESITVQAISPLVTIIKVTPPPSGRSETRVFSIKFTEHV